MTIIVNYFTYVPCEICFASRRNVSDISERAGRDSIFGPDDECMGLPVPRISAGTQLCADRATDEGEVRLCA
jgi:hypothetical protein